MRAFVFPGQGMQKKGMGAGLFAACPDLTACADHVLGDSIEELCTQDPEGRLARTWYAQPAIYVVNAMCLRRARERAEPDVVAGHSLGELSALLAAGVFDFETGLRLVVCRAKAMERASGGAMAVVTGLEREAVEEALGTVASDDVRIANYNAPTQFVLAGSKESLQGIGRVLEGKAGFQTFGFLRTSGAFHSRHMEAARAEFEAALREVELAEPTVPVVSNVTALPHRLESLKSLLAAQITNPVNWHGSVEYMRALGVTEFVEVGEGKVLARLIAKIPNAPRPENDDAPGRARAKGVGAAEIWSEPPVSADTDDCAMARREALKKLESTELRPLSASQRGHLARERARGPSEADVVPLCLRFEELDAAVLDEAWRDALGRHPELAVMVVEPPNPAFRRVDVERFHIEQVELAAELGQNVLAAVREVARRPIDTRRDLLVRLTLVRGGAPAATYCVVAGHRVVVDERSVTRVLQSLLDSYRRRIGVEEEPHPPSSGADVRGRTPNEDGDAFAGSWLVAGHGWREAIDALMTPSPVAPDRRRPGAAGRREMVVRRLGRSESHEVARLCASAQLDFEAFFASALTALVHRHTGREEIALQFDAERSDVGTPSIDPPALSIRTACSESDRFIDHAKRLHEQMRALARHPARAAMQNGGPGLAAGAPNAGHAEAEAREDSIPVASRLDLLPASFGQRRLWALAQLAPESPVYNEAAVIDMDHAAEPDVLARCVTEIIRRHEVWRTVFVSRDGEPFQKIEPARPFHLPVLDLSGVGPEVRERDAHRAAVAHARAPFDLGAGPLVRALLIRLADDRCRFVLAVHHSVCDGMSFFGAFLPELHALYRAFERNESSPLPDLLIQYADFAAWQRRAAEPALRASLAYWRDQLANLPEIDLPRRARPDDAAARGAHVDLAIPEPVVERLRERAREMRTTLFTTLVAAWKALLYKWCEQDDIVVGSAAAGRSRPELKRMVGYLSNTLVLRTRLNGRMTFRDLVARVDRVVRDARANQDVPFERLVAEVKSRRGPLRNPIFDTAINLMPPVEPLADPRWIGRRLQIGTAKVDLYVELYPTAQKGMVGYIEYPVDVFDEAVVEVIAREWRTVLGRIAGDPDLRLDDLTDIGRCRGDLDRAVPGSPARQAPGDAAVWAPDAGTVGYALRSVWFGRAMAEMRAAGGPSATFEVVPEVHGIVDAPLALDVVAGDEILLDWSHDPAEIEAQTVSRMADELVNLVRAVCETAGGDAIGRLRMTGLNQHRQLVEEWNQTDAEYPADRTCLDLIADQASAHPEWPAVSFGTETLTYGELARRTQAVSAALEERGVAPGDRVAICVERSLDMVVSMLGIMQRGAAYVPLDPDFPPARLSYMVRDSGSRLLVTHRRLGELPTSVRDGVREVYILDDATPVATDAGGASERPEGTVRRTIDSVAFLIYTSGSTGRPKGVRISQRSVTNLLVDSMRRLDVGPRARVLAIAPYSFDMAATEIFVPLIAGGHCRIADAATVRDAAALAEAIAIERPTHMIATPSTWRRLFRVGWTNAERLTILSGGEAISDGLRDELLASGAPVWNLYGPTEATMHATAKRLRPRELVTIGRPIDNTQVYVLDATLEPVPIGVPGELCIGGHGVALGYHEKPDLTAERFVPDPFRPGQMLYRTGDRARRLPDGDVVLVDRMDRQVKLRGFRVELSEVEAAMRSYPGVAESVAVVARDDNAGDRLVGYWCASGAAVDPASLRAYLTRKLPPYMVPTELVQLDAFPLSPTGKIDHAQLGKLRKPTHEDVEESTGDRLIEQRLRAIFRSTTGGREVRDRDGFFDLGGDSFGAIAAVERINKEFGCELKVTELFAHPSVYAMARHLESRHGSSNGRGLDSTSEPRATVPARAWLSRRTAKAAPVPEGAVAVIGLSCRFPGARTHREFWRNLIEGRAATRFWSMEELRALGVPETVIGASGFVPLRTELEGRDSFDPAFFGMSPRDAELMDPQGRLLLMLAWNAVEDAGYRPEDIPNTSVIMSATNSWYQAAHPTLLTNMMGNGVLDSVEDYVAWMFAQGGSIPTFVSHKLGLRGPSLYVSTNCSSALTCLYLAFHGLLRHETDQALVGAAAITSAMSRGYVHLAGTNFASDGRCKAFDDAADGLAGGEGAGVVLLKRARDAIDDGDHVYCFIRGVSANNDGSDKAGFYAPSVSGQAEVIRRTLEASGVHPDTIRYVEAHGTGTKIGDPIEIAALTEAYRGQTSRTGFCGVGSVKSNIGHLDAASGMAGLVKLALSLRHGRIPRTLHCRTPNRSIPWEKSPFYVADDDVRLDADGAGPARVGLSSFGIGGTNVHAVLERPPVAPPEDTGGGEHLVVISAKDPERLLDMAKSLEAWLRESRDDAPRIRSLAYTLQVGRRAMAHRAAVVAEGLDELVAALGRLVRGEASAAVVDSGSAARDERWDALFKEEPELKSLVTEWVRRGEWRKVARVWVNGVDVDWTLHYVGRTPKRVSVPAYGFASQTYRLEASLSPKPAVAESVDASRLGEVMRAAATARFSMATRDGSDGLVGRHDRETARMDDVLRPLLFAELAGLGMFEHLESAAGLLREHGIAKRFSRWLAHSIDVLVDADMLVRDEVGVRKCRAVPSADEAWRAWREWKHAHAGDAEATAKAAVAEPMLQALPRILRGQTPATAVLFPESSTALVENLFVHNAVFAYFTAVLADAVHAMVSALVPLRAGRPVRILEIGAGTGSASRAVFDRLRDLEAHIGEYAYTDVSTAFLRDGRAAWCERFRYLTFATFDVEEPPGPQGIAVGAYDIVLANNVLHATRDVVDAVRNATAPLRPGGLLLLNEIAENDLLGHVTFGLLDGWWRYRDSRRLPGGPALSSAAWAQALQDQGLQCVQFPADCAAALGQQVILAQVGAEAARSMAHPPPENSRTIRHNALSPTGQLRATPAPAADTVDSYVRRAVVEGIAAALKMDGGEVDFAKPVADYGVDSLTGVGLVRRLSETLGIELEPTVLFDHPTASKLALFIAREHGDELRARRREGGEAAPGGGRPWPGSGLGGEPPSGVTDSSPAKVSVAAMDNPRAQLTSRKAPIAIVGISGRFPGANGVDDLWQRLERGENLVNRVDRWDLSASTSRCLFGGFMSRIDTFDNFFFNISGVEAMYMDPQHRLVLEESWKALEDAGYAGKRIGRERCGVYVGCTAGDYFDLGGSSEYPAQALWGNMASIVPARVSYFLDLHGPAIAVDTACSSSLVAVHLACQDLWAGKTTLAIAGGAYVPCSPKGYTAASRAGMLSPSGRCYSFDDRADGFVPAEGVAILILKPLDRALADGDNVYGAIAASGINQDGTTNGITAPSAAAQERLIRETYDEFAIDCAEIQMVEAHGTGTRLGDPVEFQALTRAFRHYTDRRRFCSLGSSKANLGHAQMAAGVIGIIKVLLAMKHRVIPPLCNYLSPNATIDLDDSPFYVHTDPRAWRVDTDVRRRAAVTSLGASGTNAHVVIEEVSLPPSASPAYSWVLVAVSGRTAESLERNLSKLLDFIGANSGLDLEDVSYTLLVGRRHFEHRYACTVGTTAQLGAAIRGRLAGEGTDPSRPGPEAAGAGGRSEFERLEAIATRYLSGEALDFDELFADSRPRFVSLPTYSFEPMPYWVPRSPMEAERPQARVAGVPPASDGGSSDRRVAGEEFFFRDHRVRGVPLLPGAMYLEVACAMVLRSGPSKRESVRLENVVFLCPLRPRSEPIVLRTQLDRRDGVSRFEVRSIGANAGDDATHCQGDVSSREDAPPATLDVEALLRGHERLGLDSHAFYEEFETLGLEYGPTFRGYAEAYRGPESVLAKLRLPQEVELEGAEFVMNPVLVDCAMQCVRLLPAREGSKGSGGVVFAVKRVDVFAPCAPTMWAWIRYDTAGPNTKVDIDLADERGVVCVAIRGVAARAVDTERPATAPGALVPAWDAVAHRPGATRWPDVARRVAIVGGTQEARDALRAAYPNAIAVDRRDGPGEAALRGALDSGLPLDHVFWLSPAAKDDWTGKDVTEGQSSGVVGAFGAIRALLAAGYGSRSLGWTFVTNRAYAVADDEPTDPTHASLSGFAGVVAKEYPNWEVRSVDLQEYDVASVRAVLQIPPDPDGNLLVRREGQWLRTSLIPLTPVGTTQRAFRRRGTYVLAGGAGGLGTALTEHLAKEYDAQVVWLGRSQEERIRQSVDRIATFGPRPYYIRADAGDRDAIRKAHAEIRLRFGKVHGIVHSAFVLSGATLARTSDEQFESALRTKVDVAASTMAEFGGRDLDVAIYLSSINSYLKAIGQASYSAGCTFIDAFARAAARRHACTVKVINLGYCFNNGTALESRRMPGGSQELIEKVELIAGIELLVGGPLGQMTWTKVSGSKTPRGMVCLPNESIVVGRTSPARESAGRSPADAHEWRAELSRARERMRTIADLRI